MWPSAGNGGERHDAKYGGKFVRATSPETGRPVEAALCEAGGACERVWRAAALEELEVEYEPD